MSIDYFEILFLEKKIFPLSFPKNYEMAGHSKNSEK